MSKLDYYTAVFNLHINDAGKTALETVNEMFPKDSPEVAELNKDYKDGIMNIFKKEPNPVSNAFVAIVYYLVNKRKEHDIN